MFIGILHCKLRSLVLNNITDLSKFQITDSQILSKCYNVIEMKWKASTDRRQKIQNKTQKAT